MIEFENTEVMGWEHAIRGMRVGPDDEAHARIRHPRQLFVRQVHFFGIEFDVRPIVARRLGDFRHVAKAEEIQVCDGIERIFLDAVDVCSGVAADERGAGPQAEGAVGIVFRQ